MSSTDSAPGLEDLAKERELLLQADKEGWTAPPPTIPPSDDAVPHFLSSLSIDNPDDQPKTHPYGFLSSHSLLFPQPPDIHNDLDELGPSAESLSALQRLQRSEASVEDKFDGGMYQGDYVYDEEIMELVRWEAPAKEELRKGKGKEKEETKDDEYFAEDEKMLLDSLAVKEFPNPPDPSLLPTLLFLLFSTAYETRISMADPSPESGWTLTSLLPIFTSLTSPSSYPTTTSVLLALYKRTLSFPLYRHWGLAEKVREDVADVLEGGRRSVMRSLLGMKRILDGTEAYAVYSIIWVDDALACLLAMQDDALLKSFAKEVRSTIPTKAATGWPLEELEAETREAGGDLELD